LNWGDISRRAGANSSCSIRPLARLDHRCRAGWQVPQPLGVNDLTADNRKCPLLFNSKVGSGSISHSQGDGSNDRDLNSSRRWRASSQRSLRSQTRQSRRAARTAAQGRIDTLSVGSADTSCGPALCAIRGRRSVAVIKPVEVKESEGRGVANDRFVVGRQVCLRRRAIGRGQKAIARASLSATSCRSSIKKIAPPTTGSKVLPTFGFCCPTAPNGSD
jgi:hypothetical protein